MVAVEAQAAGLPVLASTAVPREAIIIPELIKFLSLSEGLDHWASYAPGNFGGRRASRLRSGEGALMRLTFSIENSARKLLRIWDCGEESFTA